MAGLGAKGFNRGESVKVTRARTVQYMHGAGGEVARNSFTTALRPSWQGVSQSL